MNTPDLFAANFEKPVDGKGRVSVPPRFRAMLKDQSFDGLYVRRHLNEPALECGGAAWLNEANGLVAGLDPFSDELEDVRMAMMGDAEMLAFDPEGRVTLPRELMDFTGISGKARFVGMQTYFMIWQPERYAARAEMARARLTARVAARKAQGGTQ